MPIKLINMKRAKQKGDNKVETAEPYYNEIPYGMRLRLEKPEIDKLKIDLNKLSVGDNASIIAHAEVVLIGQNATTKAEEQNLELQVTQMAVSFAGAKKNPSKFKDYQDVQNSEPE